MQSSKLPSGNLISTYSLFSLKAKTSEQKTTHVSNLAAPSGTHGGTSRYGLLGAVFEALRLRVHKHKTFESKDQNQIAFPLVAFDTQDTAALPEKAEVIAA